MAAHQLATLVSMCPETGLSAEHVPLLWRDDGSEYGVLGLGTDQGFAVAGMILKIAVEH